MKEDEGPWIKFYIKSQDHELFIYDHTAWHIFQFCLLRAYPSGSFTIGRNQLQIATGVTGITAYKALKRLQNRQMVNISSNNRFSTISICNWNKYQTVGNNLGNNEVTTEEQPSNNQVTHYKNKNIDKEKDDNTNVLSIDIPKKKNETYLYWEEMIGEITTKQETQRKACVSIQNKYGIENCQKMIRVVVYALTDKYARKEVKCMTPSSLEYNWDKVVIYAKSVANMRDSSKKGILSV